MTILHERSARTNTEVAPSGASRDVSRRSVIEEAKALVPTTVLADRLLGPGPSEMRRVGDRWVARCPLPGHEEKTPSFTVYPETNSWYCFGACLKGGDVVDLAAAAWGYGPGEMAMAAADLLNQFGHPIPEKPPAWYARQKRQAPVRDLIEAAKLEHVRDLVFRLVWMPWLRGLPDETREAAAQDAWAKSRTLAAMIYERRRMEA